MDRNLIFLCADRKFLPAAWVTAEAIRQQGTEADVVIFVDELLPEVDSIRVVYIDPSPHLPREISDGHLSTTAYLRLIVPAELGNRYDRVLYVDCDMLIEAPIDDLFSLDLKGKILAATSNQLSRKRDRSSVNAYLETIGVDSAKPFLNSGLLLIDTKAWIDRRVTARCMDYLRSMHETIDGMDQDTLNAVLGDEWIELSPAFNLQTTFFSLELEQFLLIRFRHFKGPIKPWHELAWPHEREYVARYRALFAASPWPDFLKRSRSMAQFRLALRLIMRRARARWRPLIARAFSGSRRRLDEKNRILEDFRSAEYATLARGIAEGRYADIAQGLTPVNRGVLMQPNSKAD